MCGYHHRTVRGSIWLSSQNSEGKYVWLSPQNSEGEYVAITIEQ